LSSVFINFLKNIFGIFWNFWLFYGIFCASIIYGTAAAAARDLRRRVPRKSK
jgi:hypothetical protein